MGPLCVGVWIRNRDLAAAVAEVLEAMPVRRLPDPRPDEEWPGCLDAAARLRPDVLLIDLTSLRQPFGEVAQAIHAALPRCLLIAVNTEADPEIILEAIRAGAGEYLYPPLAKTLRHALQRRMQELAQEPDSASRPGRVLGVLAVKGGCGATTVACHLAAEFGRISAAGPRRALLFDMDFDAGIIGFLMKARSPYSVGDALNNTHRLDRSYWQGLVSNGWTGLDVISAPSAPEAQDTLSIDHLREVLAFTRLHYAWVVVDLGRGLGRTVREVFHELDEIYLVATLEVPSLHQAKRTVQLLQRQGYPKDNTHLLLNRTPHSGTGLSADEIERAVGVPIHDFLPNDLQALDECYCEGRLLSASSNLGRQISRIAMRAAGVPEEKGKRRFLLFR